MRKIFLYSVFTIILAAPQLCEAKTFAYLWGIDDADGGSPEESLFIFDTDNDLIVSKRPANTQGSANMKGGKSAIDLANKVLFKSDPNLKGIWAYNLETLALIKMIPTPAAVQRPTAFRIIVPLTGNQFYLQVLDKAANGGVGAFRGFVYEKGTLKFIAETSPFVTSREDKFWLGANNRLYVEDARADNVRIYDLATQNLVATVNITSIVAPNLRGKAVRDVKSERLLIGENHSQTQNDPSKFAFLTYSIPDASVSVRVFPGVMDQESFLTPDGKRVIYSESMQNPPRDGKGPRKGDTTGQARLHIFDVASGRELGVVSIPIEFGGRILAIRPSGDKLYYFSGSRTIRQSKLVVVDLNTFSVKKSITVPSIDWLVFFDQ